MLLVPRGTPVTNGELSQSGIVVEEGTVTVYVGLIDSDGQLVGEMSSRAITILGNSIKKSASTSAHL